MKIKTIGALGLLLFTAAVAQAEATHLLFIKAQATDQAARTRISRAGLAIDAVLSDSVTLIGTPRETQALKRLGIPYEATPISSRMRQFPSEDRAFHDYAGVSAALDKLAQDFPKLAQTFSIGKSLEGRDIRGVRLSAEPTKDVLPTALFLGCHHAREHLSVEVPLKLAQYLTQNYAQSERVRDLLNTREVWIVPLVNPDGAEYDVQGGSYQYWRKNRQGSGGQVFGVDLNRNYGGPGYGGEGSSDDPSSETYHGPSAFSEPETQAVRDFVRARAKATVLLTFHTFSELVLWPWGYTNASIQETKDRQVFEKLGNKMAEWNHYTAEKASDLYLASGDTTDWAYSDRKIFAFTFELSPSSWDLNGFYPGAQAIQPTFDANLEPALYLIQNAINPYDVLNSESDPLSMLN